MNTTRLRRQRGLTLVELMIALTLGLLLTIGVIQIFLSGQQSYRLQSGLSTVQDGGRISVYFLQQGLRIAGRPRELRPVFFQPFVITNDDDGLPATRDGDDANGYAPDVVTVMYQSATNCMGNTTAYGAGEMRDAFGNLYTKDQYYIGRSQLGNAASEDNPMALRCRALDINNNQVGAQTVALVDGVEDLQILYGVDRLNQDFQPDAYMRATDITAANLWPQVVSVRFAILANSITPALDEPSGARHRLLDGAAHPAFDDRLLRRVFHSTVEVRNQMP